jgi:hypothetical protein
LFSPFRSLTLSIFSLFPPRFCPFFTLACMAFL